MKRPRRRPGAVGGALWGQMLRRSWGCKMLGMTKHLWMDMGRSRTGQMGTWSCNASLMKPWQLPSARGNIAH